MFCEIIRARFQMSKHTTVKEWKDTTKCPLSLFTCTGVINQNKEPSVPTFIVMAYLLGMSAGEIAEACKAAGDTVFWRLIAPPELTEEEMSMLNSIRSLDVARKDLVKDLIIKLSE